MIHIAPTEVARVARGRHEVESLIARMGVVLTTRVHGMVFAIKNGVPPLVVDPIAGGGKVQHQAQLLGWPAHFNVEDLTDNKLQRAFDYCLTDEARRKVRECATIACEEVRTLRKQFIAELARL